MEVLSVGHTFLLSFVGLGVLDLREKGPVAVSGPRDTRALDRRRPAYSGHLRFVALAQASRKVK